MAVSVALEKCASYEDPELDAKVFRLLENCDMRIKAGERVLVKPNLLMKRPLACTSPQVVSSVCKWLLEHGAHLKVADSPGFGNVEAITKAIGLDVELKKLGLKVEAFGKSRKLAVSAGGKEVIIRVASEVFQNDRVFSVCRVKAHSQLRLTLAVKNCYGCIPGLHKAFVHARYGDTTKLFAECVASLYQLLPRVHGVADGIIAMHVTGPSKGEPFPLHFLGASANPVFLDLAICKLLQVNPQDIPLSAVLLENPEAIFNSLQFPLEKPENFNSNGFILPKTLKAASFNPWRLFRSCVKRIWKRYSI